MPPGTGSSSGHRAVKPHWTSTTSSALDFRESGCIRSPPATGGAKSQVVLLPLTTGSQYGLHQPFRHPGTRSLFRGTAGQLTDTYPRPVALQVDDTLRAVAQVLREYLALGEGQLAVQVSHQKVGDFAAVHGEPFRKCGSRRVRSAWRARCNRVFTTPSLTPSWRAVSAVSNPSMSRRTKTVR